MPRWSTNIPLVTSVAAIVLALLVMVTQVAGLVSAALTPSIGGDRTTSRLNEYLDEHDEWLKTFPVPPIRGLAPQAPAKTRCARSCLPLGTQ